MVLILETAGKPVDAQIGGNSLLYEEEVYALTTIFINEYLYSRLVGVNEETNLRLWLLTNNWLEKIAPINYWPSVAEFLSNIGLKKIWEVDVPLSIVEDLLLKPIHYRLGNGFDRGELRRFIKELVFFVSKLSGLEKHVVYGKLKDICSLNIDCYIYAATLALTMSTNI